MTDEDVEAWVAEDKVAKKMHITVGKNHQSMYVTGPFKSLYDAEQNALADSLYSGREVFALTINTDGHRMVSQGVSSVFELHVRGKLQPELE